MSELIVLEEARTLVMEAVRTVNELDEGGPPELHDSLRRIRCRLDSVLESIDRTTDPDPFWPGLAARA
jgi:hypothetical protein